MDSVKCSGKEKSILDCPFHLDKKLHNCIHTEDIGVVCRSRTGCNANQIYRNIRGFFGYCANKIEGCDYQGVAIDGKEKCVTCGSDQFRTADGYCKNKNKKIVILDIPLLLESKINKKNDILVFVKSRKSDVSKRLRKRENFNAKLLNKFKNIQLSLDHKKKKSQFIIKNNFTNKSVIKSIKQILKDIL